MPLSPGDHSWISQVPDCSGSLKKKCRWNVQTCGSLRTMGSVSVAPSWILTVPLLPGVSFESADAGANSATATRAVAVAQPSHRKRCRPGGPSRVVRRGMVLTSL